MNDTAAGPGPASPPGARRPAASRPGTAQLSAEEEPPGDRPRSDQADQEAPGCLFALSQPPLMFFLALIGFLLLLAAVHDLYVG